MTNHLDVLAQYRYVDHMDGAWGIAMAVAMIAIAVGVVALVVWLLSETRSRTRQETPAQVLDRRLASGEITPEEYRERSTLLRSAAPGD